MDHRSAYVAAGWILLSTLQQITPDASRGHSLAYGTLSAHKYCFGPEPHFETLCPDHAGFMYIMLFFHWIWQIGAESTAFEQSLQVVSIVKQMTLYWLDLGSATWGHLLCYGAGGVGT